MSPQHVAAAINEDQNVTHKSAGMTISPLRLVTGDHEQTTLLSVPQFLRFTSTISS
jgi:hypothetical protein